MSRVIRCLDDLGIDYMLTGCYASSIQGEPRSTHDIDLVVSLTSDDADNFVEAFTDPEFYLLDMAYLEEWAGRLGVSDLWARLKAKAAPI